MIRKFRVNIIIITCFAYLASSWLFSLVVILYVVISKQNSDLGQMLNGTSTIETILNVGFASLLSMIDLVALIPIGIMYGVLNAFFFSIFNRRMVFILCVVCSGVFVSSVIYVVGIMIPDKLADTISFFGTYQSLTSDTEFWLTPSILGTTFIIYLYTKKQFSKNI